MMRPDLSTLTSGLYRFVSSAWATEAMTGSIQMHRAICLRYIHFFSSFRHFPALFCYRKCNDTGAATLETGVMVPSRCTLLVRPAVRPLGPERPEQVATPSLVVRGCEGPHELLGLGRILDAPGGHDATNLDQPAGADLALRGPHSRFVVPLPCGELLRRGLWASLPPALWPPVSPGSRSLVAAVHAPDRTRSGHLTDDRGGAGRTEWRTYANSGFASVCRAPSGGR